MFSLLATRGARIDRHDKDNFTPLLIAACNGHADTIKALLELGARIDDVDKNDKSALYWAAEEDNVVALKVGVVTSTLSPTNSEINVFFFRLFVFLGDSEVCRRLG